MEAFEKQPCLAAWACPEETARVALLSAPFTFPPIPSIALSIFQRALSEAGIAARVLYPMFPFLHLMGAEQVQRVFNVPGFQSVCEYLFAPLADPSCGEPPERFVQAVFPERPPEERQEMVRLLRYGRECASGIVEATALRVVRMGAGILAASSIYAQQNASLAVCRRVKELNPDVVTLIGGTNVSGEMGLAVLRRYPSVDFVSFGEGDETIVPFCRAVLSGEHGPLPFGILGKADAGVAEAPHRLTRDMNTVCAPDYRDYFAEISRERAGAYGPSLLPREEGDGGSAAFSDDSFFGRTVFLEGSRGCWWGQKHPCSFCGLNGQVNVYREKKPEKLLREIREAVDAHPGCMIQLSDNVLGAAMFRELLPALEADAREYRLSAEVKTNLRESDVAALARAGFRWVQPGIESLNDHLLALMGKGNTAVHHAALLKYCRRSYIHPFWHLLYGVPGEEARDYEETVALIPLLTHLPPPTGANPILFQRFSRYALHPEAFGLELTPDRGSRFCFGGDEAFLRQTAMYYNLTGGPFLETKRRHQELYRKLSDAAEMWKGLRSGNVSPDLIMVRTKEGISLLDTRPCRARLMTRLTGAACAVYQLADAPVSPDAVREALKGTYSAAEIDEAAARMEEDRLLLRLSGKLLALAV